MGWLVLCETKLRCKHEAEASVSWWARAKGCGTGGTGGTGGTYHHIHIRLQLSKPMFRGHSHSVGI